MWWLTVITIQPCSAELIYKNVFRIFCMDNLWNDIIMVEGVSRRFLARSSSGTTNVYNNEFIGNLGRLKSINVTVVFLDDTQHCFKLNVSVILEKTLFCYTLI